MEIIYLVIAVAIAIATFLWLKKPKHKSLTPLMPEKYNFGKRQVTFREIIKLLEKRKANTIVETGVARGGLRLTRTDGASTIVFGSWAKKNQAVLHSVDIDPEAIKEAQAQVDQFSLQNHVNLHVKDSVDFLSSFQEKVDFLYLDSFDYPRNNSKVQRESQEHHLKEFKAIESRLHDKSFVLIDDCKRPGGGKGKLVIKYMQQNGWIIHLKAYQILLVKS